MKNILISTGGSGGHVVPSLIMFDHLKENFNVQIVTDQRGSKFINKESYVFNIIDVPNLKSSFLKLPINVIKFLFSFINSYLFLKKHNINILISTGGYMSFPLCCVSILTNTKLILFEPNMVLGRSNKIMLKFSKKIICYYEKIINYPDKEIKKIFLIDYLLRKEVYNLKTNLNNQLTKKLNILVLGGSQGASIFDNLIQKLIIKISKLYEIKLTQQIYDNNKKQQLENSYKSLKIQCSLFQYNHDLFKDLQKFNLIITRCGASALAEISYFNIPFIAIPFPHSKDNHQFYNAKYFSDKNCCWIFKENNSTLNELINLFEKLIKDDTEYKTKQTNLQNISYQNSWNNINKKLIELINEY